MANKKPAPPKGDFSQAVRIGGAALVAALAHATSARCTLRQIVEAALVELLTGVSALPRPDPQQTSKRKTHPKTKPAKPATEPAS